MSEPVRLDKIREFGLYIGQEDPQLNGLMNALAGWLNVPMAFVSIVDKETQFFKAKTGFDGTQIDPEPSFCNYVVKSDEQLLINDAQKDKQFKDNPYVTQDPNIRFYAGVPLRLDDVTVGTVCVLDTQPREFSNKELDSLAQVSEHVSQYLTLSLRHQQLLQERSFIDDTPAALIKWRYNMALELQYVSANISTLFNVPAEELRAGISNFEDFLDDKGRKELNFLLGNHLAGVTSSEAQFKVVPPKGPERWVKLLSKSFYDPDGELENIHAMLIDNTANRYFERRLNEANQQMRLVLEASGLGTWDWNVLTDTNKVNHRWCELLGLDYANFDPSLYFWQSLVHPADLKRVERELQAHMTGATPAFSTIYRMRHTEEYWVWIETYGRVVERDAQGKALRLTGTHRDITEKKEAELLDNKQRQLLSFINKAQAQYLNEKNLSKACQDILPELIDIADSQFGFIGEMQTRNNNDVLYIHAISELSWNEQSSGLYKAYLRGELFFESLDNLFGRTITSNQVVLTNEPNKHKASRGTPSGHPRIMRFLGLPIRLQGNVVGMIGLANKLSDYEESDATFLQPLLDALGALFYAVQLDKARMDAERRLKNLAMTDALTGLPNRRAFIEHCQLLNQTQGALSVAILDIDHFKRVNDTYGHAAGDAVIKHLAESLTRNIRSDDMAARLGGEEFALILSNSSKEKAHQRLEQLRTDIEQAKVSFDGDKINYTVSIGALFIHDQHVAKNDIEHAVLDHADKALYEAKKSGRNRVVWCT